MVTDFACATVAVPVTSALMTTKHPIARYREARGLTVGDLATRIGVSRTTVWRWENEKRRPDDRLLPIVSKVTGIPILDLMNLDEAA